MIVIGIDPAPAKGLMICSDHGFDRVLPDCAKAYIDTLSSKKNVLICWDSPLTGPPATYLDGKKPTECSEGQPNPYVQRPIERTLSALVKQQPVEGGSKSTKVSGISTLPYSQCSHWTISRALIGLPVVGPYDRTDNLPFELITTNVVPTKSEKYIVEVHPAVALWLWLKDKRSNNDDGIKDGEGRSSWQYKSGKDKAFRAEVLKDLWAGFRQMDCVSKVLDDEVFPMTPCTKSDKDRKSPHTDDHLDAMVAYTLGKLWEKGTGDVKLYGNKSCGSMLLPVEVERYLDEATNKVLCPKHNES